MTIVNILMTALIGGHIRSFDPSVGVGESLFDGYYINNCLYKLFDNENFFATNDTGFIDQNNKLIINMFI